MNRAKTDAQLAVDAQISPASLSRYFSGDRDPTLGAIEKMATGWKVTEQRVIEIVRIRRSQHLRRNK